jgi:hypothetical protein
VNGIARRMAEQVPRGLKQQRAKAAAVPTSAPLVDSR